jgi:Tol biopolymer transport system component
MRVPASGGTPAVLTTPDGTRGERVHTRPTFLPDGKTVLFNTECEEVFRCASVALETGEVRVLIEPGSNPRYLPSGHLVYGSLDRGELLVAPFDPVALRTTGPAVIAVSGVAPFGRGKLGFDVADDGTLVYDPSEFGEDETILVWLDRSGARAELDPERSTWTQPKLSPDGKRLLLRRVGSPACTLWMRDLERGVLTRVDARGDCHDPVWSLDGTCFLYDAAGGSAAGVFRRSPDGAAEELLAAAREHDLAPTSLAPDGKTLVMNSNADAATRPDIHVLEIGGGERPFLHTKFAERAAVFSPDGRYLAYVSDETGTSEVYVRAFPGPGEAVRVSTSGGLHPTWSRDGSELFFTLQGKMFAVPASTSPALRLGKPELLFETDAAGGLDEDYDVSPDGQRFVVALSPRKAAQLAFVRVVVNWFEELRQLAPGGSSR